MSDWIIWASRSHRRRILWVSGINLRFSSGEAGDTGTTTIEVTFTDNVTATDYKAGVTIKVNAVSQTINTATRQADHRVVHYVIAAAADVNDTITWEYSAGGGDYQDDNGDPLGDVSAETLDNWIGSHLYFDTADDAVWIGAV